MILMEAGLKLITKEVQLKHYVMYSDVNKVREPVIP